MNNKEARQILSAYRPSGVDAEDPHIQAALEQARRDPELGRWFEEERRFDEKMAEALQEISVPVEGRANTLNAGRLENRGRSRFPAWLGGLAAAAVVLLAGIGAIYWTVLPDRNEVRMVEDTGLDGFIEMASSAMPFSHRADSFAELHSWLQQRGAPVPANVPEALAGAGALGCTVFQEPDGSEISLFCLLRDGEAVHLFVMRGDTPLLATFPRREWQAREGWNAYAWGEQDQRFLLLSRAPREEMERWVDEA